jgi:WD40 repeat protein
VEKLFIVKKINSIITPKLTSQDYINGKNDKIDNIGTLSIGDDDDDKQRKVSLFLHNEGKEPLNSYDHFTHIVTDKISIPLGLNIKNNSKFVVFPSQATGGGSLAIIRGNYKYRGRQYQKEIRAHIEQITCFDISLLNENLIATGAGDAKVFVWCVPNETDDIFWNNKNSNSISNNNNKGIEKKYILQHSGKVTYVGFHPNVENILITAEKTSDEVILHLWDLTTGNRVLQWKNITLNNSAIMDFVFDTTGHLSAISSQDGLIRIIDIRNKQIILTFESLENKRDTKLFWINNDCKLLTLGFGKGSQRRLSIWDISSYTSNYLNSNNNNQNNNENKEEVDEKNEAKDNRQDLQPIIEKSFGTSNAIPIGYYDRDTNLFYFTSIADRKIKVYEITNTSINEMTGKYEGANEVLGMSFKSKFDLNYDKVEINFCYKLSRNEISPISWCIPRKRLEYFQDDLYPLTLSLNQSLMTHSEWLYDKKIINIKDIKRISLKPNNMIALSEAPNEDLTDLQKKRNVELQKMEQEKKKEGPRNAEQALEAFSRIVADTATVNRWDAVPIASEVADDEWSD